MKIFIYVFFTFTSHLHPFLDHFKFGACFSLSLTLYSLENLVVARCFTDFSAHLAKFSQFQFCESLQFTNIAKYVYYLAKISRSTVVVETALVGL